MSSSTNTIISLDSLAKGVKVITPEAVGFYKENCMVCFDNQGHTSGVKIRVIDVDGSEESFCVQWTGDVTEQLRRSYKDLKKATDFAACTIALLLVRELTECSAVEQAAATGTTVDYYLNLQEKQDDDLIFNHVARLEVSGILCETGRNSVKKRLTAKLKRLSQGLPTIIIIVEFSRPWSKLDCHE